MKKRGISSLQVSTIASLLTLAALPAHGAGFGLFEQGTKAMGMAGAFTAQTDDPSLFFYNVGGLGHAAARAAIPFGRDLPIETSIEFPDMASLGLAFSLTGNLLLETDFNWTGWSSFDETTIRFPQSPQLNSTIRSEWDDVYNYRAGLRWRPSSTSEWRFGAYYDETPQPEEAVSPLLPDADRRGLTLGYGYTGTWKLDVAIMYVDFDERTRNRSFPPGEPNFFGAYQNEAWLFGLTFGR